MQKASRILFITSASYIYGAEKISLSVIRYLNHLTTLYCVVNGWNDGAFAQELLKADIHFSQVKLGWFYKRKIWWTFNSLMHFPAAFFKYYKILKKTKSDFVYHTSYRSILQLYPLLKKNNIYHVHDKLSGTIGEKIIRFADKKIVCYIAVSQFIKQDLISCGVDAGKINVVYNGVPSPSDSLIKNIPKDENHYHVGIVGQISKRKGHLFLFDALTNISSMPCKITLHFFGTGEIGFVNNLKSRADFKNMPFELIFHGYVTDKNEIYQLLDFCIIPSIEPESFGLAVVEPAYYGLPVIASDQASFMEIIEPYKTGLIFKKGDACDFVNQFMTLLNNPSLIGEMGQNAKKTYELRFSETKMVKEIFSIIKNMGK